MPACGSIRPPQAPTLTVNACPAITRCQLPAAAPRTNGAMNLALERAEAAWGTCAAKVDAVVDYQEDADRVQAK
ncbi:Rz1-like lysis system protein LysC [Collimonas sp.]|uniref:Rz1-like lysis system protein LysC n=1 Tax=Collimonas sp. TaxID=1963772 RepID=UPI002C36E6D4|nr:Rz1-like lysis system protein LysC [Collimonas sp.]HWX02505.1 Rz1-like lysis system protein LysC [Collimonas sp.]